MRPAEVHYHGVPKVEGLDQHIAAQFEKLARFHANLGSCTVHVHRAHPHHSAHDRKPEKSTADTSGTGWKVGLEVVVPHHGDVVVSKDSEHGDAHENLLTLVNQAFDVMGRRLSQIGQKERGEQKSHTLAATIPSHKVDDTEE